MMIRTITLNTGFDETLVVDAVDAGGVAQILERRSAPSGKGINCARTLRALGHSVTAYGFIGRAERERFSESLRQSGVECQLITVDAPTRTNFTVQPIGNAESTHYRAQGFTLNGSQPAEYLVDALARDVQPGDLVSLHGSTPGGLAPDTWATIGRAVARRGAQLLVDVHGEPLIRVLANSPVTACKPNDEEVGVLPGVTGGTRPDRLRTAIHWMAASKVGLPIISLGPEGLLFYSKSVIWQARLEPAAVRVRVGAGDACMAGLAAAAASGVTDHHELVRGAIAAAVAHVEGLTGAALAARATALAPGVTFEAVDPDTG
jgi:1-phosphofructokinase family hexose kinase